MLAFTHQWHLKEPETWEFLISLTDFEYKMLLDKLMLRMSTKDERRAFYEGEAIINTNGDATR